MSLRNLLCGAVACTTFWAFAGSVEFTDGRVYDYKLVSENAFGYVLLIDGMRVQIPRNMIAGFSDRDVRPPVSTGQAGELRNVAPQHPFVARGEAFATAQPPAPELRPLCAGEVPLNVSVETPEVRPELLLPADPVQRQRLKQAVANLGLEASVDRRQEARRILAAAGDQGLAALIEYGLYNELPSVRTQAAEVLGALGGRRVIKPLIEAFYAAAVPTITPYQRAYVGALVRQISSLTGKDFTFHTRGSDIAPAVADSVVQWWNLNYDRVPPQIGEPALDPTNPNYLAELRTVRRLRLEKRQFAGMLIPPELAEPAQPNTPAQAEYAETFTRLPAGEGVERALPYSFQPQIPKIPSPARDAPGLMREQDFLQRLEAQQSRY